MKLQFDDKGLKITVPKNLSREEAAVDAAGLLVLMDGSTLSMMFLAALSEQMGEEFITAALEEYVKFKSLMPDSSFPKQTPDWLTPAGQL